MSLLPENELHAIEVWYADLKEALRVSQNADRGRVLASVRKLVAETDSYEKEKCMVVTASGYKRWGDLCTWASKKISAVPEVELPELFSTPPNGMVFRTGAKYKKVETRLLETLLRLKEVWAHLDAEVAADPSCAEWAEEQKAYFVEMFEAMTDFDEFDQTCLAFVRGYEEEDPATVWEEAAKLAAPSLEKSEHLPPVAAMELLEFAEAKGVEVTKQSGSWYEESTNPANRWFWHLLTAYLRDETRPTEDLQYETREDASIAMEKGLLYINKDNQRPGQNDGWAMETSLGDIENAYRAYKEARAVETTHNEIAKAVLLALGKTEEVARI